jgi:hypothetical protein
MRCWVVAEIGYSRSEPVKCMIEASYKIDGGEKVCRFLGELCLIGVKIHVGAVALIGFDLVF